MITRREWVDELLEAMEAGALVMDEFDDAIIGITASTEPQVVYSEAGIIEILMKEGCTDEEAWDHYGFNILGSIQPTGPYPIIVKTYDEEVCCCDFCGDA